MSPQQAYQELTTRLYQRALLSSTASILGWEERTYMPRGGARLRSEQMSQLARMLHEHITDPRIGELIGEVESSPLVKDPLSVEAVNIRELRHRYNKETKLPSELVAEISKVTTLAQGEWAEARRKRNYKMFQPWLEKVIPLKQQVADAYGFTGERYDALLDDYEPGASTADIEKVFRELREQLVVLMNKIKGAPNKPDVSIVEREYRVELQKVFGEMAAAAIGFDFGEGRLDITTHPFCSGIGPGDTRITTRYNPNRLNDALFGILHECGHALYEMGLDKDSYFGLPMGDSTSLGIHESQSRMWENQVGRSKSFWVYFFPQAKRIFKNALADVELNEFYGAINDVRPSYIRVEADEATYNLHILLRFELERAMIKGDLKAADIPGEWNSRFEKYFGLKVDHDSNGCLQDVHWSAGLMGYFPTYTLGNLYSAQFFNQARKEMPGLDQQFESGNFLGLREWLREKIHRQGGRYRANTLVEVVTGAPLSSRPLVDYMTRKYGEIYGF